MEPLQFNSKPYRVMILQLAPLSETIQTLMALRAAKQLYPQIEIHVICKEKFSQAFKRVQWIESVTCLNIDSLITPIINSEKSVRTQIPELAQWLAPLINRPWDLLLNWSFSEASSYLARLLPAYAKLGFTRKADGLHSAPDGWTQYIQAVVLNNLTQNIHFTDILTTQLLTALQIHLGDPVDDPQSSVTSKNFFNIRLSEWEQDLLENRNLRRCISIHLGKNNRNTFGFTPEKWAEVVSLILKEHTDYSIFIVGEKEDSPLEDRLVAQLMRLLPDFREYSHRLMCLSGKLSFDGWCSLLGRSQWVLGEDSAAIPLASVNGTRVLLVSTNNHGLQQIGPYGNGHYVVEAESPETDIPSRIVYETWAYASTEWSHRRQASLKNLLAKRLKDQNLDSLLNGVRLFRSKIRGTSEGGGVHYEPLETFSLSLVLWTASVFGHIAREWYCGWVPPIGQELFRPSISPTLLNEIRRESEVISALEKIFIESRSTSNKIATKSQKLKSNHIMNIEQRTELTQLGLHLTELDQMVDTLAQGSLSAQFFSNILKVNLHNLRGEQIHDMSLQSSAIYQQLLGACLSIKEWIKFTQSIVKPIMVETAQVIPIRENSL